MIDSWAIGVNIEINDNILAMTDRLFNQFDRVERAVDAINGALQRTGGIITPLIGQAQALAGAFSHAATAARGIQRAMEGTAIPAGGAYEAPGGAPGAAYPAGAPVPALYGPAAAPEPGTPGLPAVIPGQGPYGPGGPQPWGWSQIPGYGTGGTPEGPDSAPNGYTPNWVPGQPEDEPFNRPGQVPLYPGQGDGHGFDPLHGYFYGQILTGVADQVIGAPFEQAATVDQKLAILKANGMTEAQAQDAYKLAFKMQQNPQYQTLGVDTLLGIMQATYLQTGDVGEATKIMPDLANAATVLQGIGDADAKSQMFDLLRSGDLAGLLNKVGPDGKPDLTQLDQFIRTFTAIQLATGGDAIPPSQVLHLFQNAGPSLMGMDDKGMAMTMLLALSLGQQKAGTGINQMFKELVGGKMSIANEKFLESIGLLDPSKVIPGSSHGGYVQMQAGAVKDETLFMQDPVQWFVNEIGSQYAGDSPDQRQKLLHTIYASAGTAQGARVISDSIFQDNMLLRYYLRSQGLPDLPTMANQFNVTPQGSADAAGAATKGLIVTLSNDTMSAFQPMLNFYTKVANHVTSEAQTHPNVTFLGEIDAAMLATWAGFKSLEKAPWLGGASKVAGIAGDGLMRMVPLIAAAEAVWETSQSSVPDKIGKALGLPNWALDPDLLKHLFSSGNQPVVDAIHGVTAAIKGQQAPAMPSGPTGHNSHTSPPAPGQALPNNW